MRAIFIRLIVLLTCAHSAPGQHDGGTINKLDDYLLNAQYNKALELLEQGSAEGPSLLLDNRKAELLTRSGKLDEAAALLKDLAARAEYQGDNFMKAITCINTGYLQLNQGRSDLAIGSLKDALELVAACGKQNSAEAAQALSYLGLVYMSQGKYSQAQEHLHQALSMREKITDGRDALLAATYNDLGLVYSQTNHTAALEFYHDALEIYNAIYGASDPRIAIVNINIGVIRRNVGQFSEAINNFESALTIWNETYAQSHPAKAIAFYNLGQAYLGLNDQKAAMEYYNLALQMYTDYYGPKHPEIVTVLNAIGSLQAAGSDFDGALSSYQKALHANVHTFADPDPAKNPSAEKCYNGTSLLHTLLFKAQAFGARYTRKSLKFSDLKEALNVLAICDTLVDRLRHQSANESDKMTLGIMASEIYSEGVRVAFLAAENGVRKEPYYEKAFYFAEKSKGAVLLETIADANAKSFAGVPARLLEEERNLNSALTLNGQKLAQKPPVEVERYLREEQFGLKTRYDGFVQQLEREYPKYFDLKFNVQAPGIPQLQSLLNDQTAIVSYFVDEKHGLYIFLIRKKKFKVWHRPLDITFEKYITGLRNGIYFQDINTFKQTALALGRTLLPPLPSSIKDLVVLPAGRLAAVPFETLLTKDVSDVADYASMPYVLKRYSIRYEFSAGLLFQKSRKAIRSTPSILLCAPVSFPGRKDLGELPGSANEVQEIAAMFKEENLQSATFTGPDADEGTIKTPLLKDFGLIHFATHGVVNETDPELSRIFLQSTQQEDGSLYAGEIYNLDLSANLVTLSACQTGMGKVVKGEGVIGLSRALVYAGARNILVSFWSVADESTATLMKGFYRNLLRTPRGDLGESLRQSKLQLMDHKTFSPPFYWAPFVLIGY